MVQKLPPVFPAKAGIQLSTSVSTGVIAGFFFDATVRLLRGGYIVAVLGSGLRRNDGGYVFGLNVEACYAVVNPGLLML